MCELQENTFGAISKHSFCAHGDTLVLIFNILNNIILKKQFCLLNLLS